MFFCFYLNLKGCLRFYALQARKKTLRFNRKTVPLIQLYSCRSRSHFQARHKFYSKKYKFTIIIYTKKKQLLYNEKETRFRQNCLSGIFHQCKDQSDYKQFSENHHYSIHHHVKLLLNPSSNVLG